MPPGGLRQHQLAGPTQGSQRGRDEEGRSAERHEGADKRRRRSPPGQRGDEVGHGRFIQRRKGDAGAASFAFDPSQRRPPSIIADDRPSGNDHQHSVRAFAIQCR